MTVTTTHVNKARLMPLGGSHNRYKLGFIDAGTKLLQNDVLVVDNVSDVKSAVMTTDASGVADPITISTASLTMTGATGTAPSGLIIFRK